MFVLSQTILNRPVMSLRSGGQIGQSEQPIINPDNLKIEGFYCHDKLSGKRSVLLIQDIRDIIEQGIIVDDHTALSDPTDLLRLKKIIEINFKLVGKPVQTVSKDKVGKVIDFATDVKSFYIQKIYVGQSLIKSFRGGQLSVDRSQINEVTNRRIIINDLLKGVLATVPA